MSDTNDRPEWFDEERHLATPRGVYELDTGLQLASDGLPVAGMIRAQRLALAGITDDPLGLIDADLIAAEGRRLKQLHAAEAEAAPTAGRRLARAGKADVAAAQED